MGSGKTTVAELLRAFGAELIDFDGLAREALAPETPGWAQALELFGPKAKKPDNSLDRARLAEIIFKKPDLRKALEAIVHPLTWELMGRRLAELQASPLVIIDVPLLFEANLNSLFRPVIVCFASWETQYQRLRSRDPNRSRGLTKKMLQSQLPFSEKIRQADVVINNDGSLIDLIRRAKDLWLMIKDYPGPAKTI
jgi:dephospho-CoA kinase